MTKKKKKKRTIGSVVADVLILLLFLAGVGVFLYPTVSDMWNDYRSSRLIADYRETVAQLDEADYREELNAAQEYNLKHRTNTVADAFSEEKQEEELTAPYSDLLNPAGDGVMGYLEIPKINVNLEIYHGTGREALEKGCGHVEGTSLPVGGAGNHAVLAGHSGLPSAELLTDLDQLEEGDLFFLTVLNEKLAYRVDRILVVLPEETDYLAIEKDQDYVTLVTCTPYGINTHRLLVRGVRAPYEEAKEQTLTAEAQPEEGLRIQTEWVAAAVVLLLSVIICRTVTGRKKRRPGGKEDEEK